MTVQVGLIGLGAMGLGMAQSLRRAGHTVHVYDVRAEAAKAFAKDGGVVAASPAALGAACDVVVSVVVNAAQTESVLFGQDGCAADPRSTDEWDAPCGCRGRRRRGAGVLMSQLVDRLRGVLTPNPALRRVIDFVDVDSAKFEAYADRDTGLRRWINAREARLLQAEEERLADPEHQQRLAEAIQNGLRAYFYNNPPPGTRVAQLAAARRDTARIAASGP